MKRTSCVLLMIVMLVVSMPAHAKKARVIRAPGGTNTDIGLVLDASYDSRLDNLVPGYKIIDVALVNQSFNIVLLHPEKDRWEIKLGGDEGKTIPAIYNLRGKLPQAYNTLPERIKPLLSYPLALPIGAREVIDIFVPDSVDVTNFTELHVYLHSVDTKLEILARQ